MSALNFKAAGNSNGTAGALPIQQLPPAVPAATAPAKHFAEQGYLRRSQLLIHHETNLTMCLMFLTSIMFAWYGIRQAVSTYKVTPRARDLMRRFGFFDYLDHGGTADEKATCLRLILSHSSKDLSTIIADCSHVPGQVLTACLYIASILVTTVDFNIINYARTDGTWFLYVAVNWIRKCSLLCLIMVLAFPLPKDDQFWTICAESHDKKQMDRKEIRKNIRNRTVEPFVKCQWHNLAACSVATLTPINLLMLVIDFVHFFSEIPFYQNSFSQADTKAELYEFLKDGTVRGEAKVPV
ncbi:unnamed protein product, partial [Amoebophrya sp. A120]|eukprot:GSA120T00000734001.1